MGQPKALLELGGETFLDRLIRVLGAHCAPMAAVVGHEAAKVRAGTRRQSAVVWVENPNYRQGQLSSLQAGLRALPAEAPCALFTLVDHPAVSAETVRALVNAPAAPVVIAACHGRRGHPVRLDAGVIAEILALSPESSAKLLIRENAMLFETGDPGVLDDIDDPAAYRALLARWTGQETR